MLGKLSPSLRISLGASFALLLVILASTQDGFGPIPAPAVLASPTMTAKLAQIDGLRDLTYSQWKVRYDELRTDVTYNWMDWSQDGCSAPDALGTYKSKFFYGCLRHDFMWRTLAVLDAAEGRVWNERNRQIADNTLRQDATTACSDSQQPSETTNVRATETCLLFAEAFYQAVRHWQYRGTLTAVETSSVDARPLDFIEYPSSATTIDCAARDNRCLPIQYIKLDGRPFAPQNIPYIASGRTVKMEVVRANLQAKSGPPGSASNSEVPISNIGRTGELLLKVKYPLQASKVASVTCPWMQAGESPALQSIYLDRDDYPITTSDKALKTTAIYIKSCRTTDAAREIDKLLELKPVEAQYSSTLFRYIVGPAGTVRHYQNIKVDSCRSVPISTTEEISGTWLGTDCVSSRRSGAYVDYYTFDVAETTSILIDLSFTDAFVDTYLYLHGGTTLSGSLLDFNDDFDGTLNSHISRQLSPGSYTIAATTYSSGNTGDYRLHIRGTPSCDTFPVNFTTSDGTISARVRISTSWTSASCESTRRAGSYVDYYTFDIEGPNSRAVRIDLESSVDTYLYLIHADNGDGTAYLAYDDDGGDDYNSRINITLVPWTYTIAATTWGDHETGAYTLTTQK